MRVKRIRGNILGSVVDARSWSLLLMIRPVRCEDFKCFSAQKEIKGFAPLLIQDLAQKFIKIGSLPSAAGKSAAGVLLRPAGSLHNAIDCDKGQDHQFSHGCLFLLLFVLTPSNWTAKGGSFIDWQCQPLLLELSRGEIAEG